jgi:hypothetical protein
MPAEERLQAKPHDIDTAASHEHAHVQQPVIDNGFGRDLGDPGVEAGVACDQHQDVAPHLLVIEYQAHLSPLESDRLADGSESIRGRAHAALDVDTRSASLRRHAVACREHE